MENIKEKVKQSDIGLYLRTVYQEFKTEDFQEMVGCTGTDGAVV